MRTWLARLTFSFFIIAFWLGWEAVRLQQRDAAGRWLTALYWVACFAAMSLGWLGLRQRHRPFDGN